MDKLLKEKNEMKSERVKNFDEIDKIYIAADKGRTIKRGEIYYIDKGPVYGSEQQGGRPGIIISNDMGNKASDIAQVVYITTQPKNNLPTHVTIHSTRQVSTVLCEQIWTITQSRVGDYVGQVTEEEMALIDKALFISLGLKTENITDQVLGIETSGDDLLELAVNHVKEVMELAERRRKAVEVYNSITDTTNVCLYQSGSLTQFGDFISAESMEQIKHSTIQAISNAKDEIEKQIMEKIGIKGRRYTGLDEEFDKDLNKMEDQHSTEIISIDTKEFIEKETDVLLTNNIIGESLPGMTEENVKELYWNQNLTIDKTAEQLGVKRSTLYNFICNHNLKKNKKKKNI